MSVRPSQKERDENLRKLEAAANEAEIAFRKAQSAAQREEDEWEGKKREVNAELTKVEERLRSFNQRMEEMTAGGRPPDEASVAKHRAKLETEIAGHKDKLALLEAQRATAVRKYLEQSDVHSKALRAAREAHIGAKEEDAMFRAEEEEKSKEVQAAPAA